MAQDIRKKAVQALDATTFVIIVAAIVVVINVILALPSTPSMRVDLTEDKLYTLSDASKAMVGGLEEPLEIKFFVSENLQYPDHNLEQRVRDLLDEYRVHSGGKFSFEVIHPKDNESAATDEAEGAEAEGAVAEAEGAVDEPKAEDKAEEGPKGFGIQKIPVGVRGEDEVALRMVYKGMALVFGDKLEVINELKGTDNLEYEISKRIKTLITPEAARHKVGFITGFGGPSDQPQFIQSIGEGFKQIYGDLITARPINLKEKQKVDDDIDAIVILNPDQMFNDNARYAIDQFLMRGKGVAWLQTGLAPNPQMPMLPMRQPVITGLEGLFETYGLRLNKDLVLDRQSNIVSLILTDRGLAQISNPSMPVFTDINQESVVTKDIPTLSFPISSSITVLPSVLENKELTVTELVKSDKGAVRRANANSVDYDALLKPDPTEEPGPFVMAASVQGSMSSHFSDKQKPASTPSSNPVDALPPDYQTLKKSTAGARIIVVGNGDFMFPNQQTGYGRQYSGLGALFLLNMVDWLVQDEALVAIRSKGVPRVLKGITADDHITYQAANVVGVPVVFVLIGLLFFFLRRQRQRTIKL